jgi:hypothetical protein
LSRRSLSAEPHSPDGGARLAAVEPLRTGQRSSLQLGAATLDELAQGAALGLAEVLMVALGGLLQDGQVMVLADQVG